MELERIQKAYQTYIRSDIYKNCEKYRKLSDGKSADVFFTDVRARVNMEYMGTLDSQGNCKRYDIINGEIKNIGTTPLKDLVVGNGILQATTRLYAEYGTNKPLIIPKKDSYHLIERFDFDDLLGKLLVIQSWAGKQLLKGVVNEKEFSFYSVTPKDYFPIHNQYNPKLTDGYVIYNLKSQQGQKDILTCEIYEKDSIEYRAYEIAEEKFKEIQYPNDLKSDGMLEDGYGYKDPNAKGMAVVEIDNIFGKPDYNDDLIGLVRELVIGDTLTSQAFQKVANPLLQVPDSLVEVDENGRSRVRLDGRVVLLRQNDKEVKQVQLETKTQEWKVHKEDIKNDIYKQLGVNDLAFGIETNGAVASGEAKRRSLERTIATVESKRLKCIKGIKEIVKWGYKRVLKQEVDLEIKTQEILSLSLTEKITIACQAVASGIMSVDTAIEFIGINESKKEMELIKSNLQHQEKIVNILSILANITREEELKVQVDNLTTELMKELGIEVKEE